MAERHVVDLYAIDLDDARWDDFADALDAAEVERFSRMIAVAAQAQQRRCRIALRRILAERLGCAPHAVHLTTSQWGKPSAVGAAFDFSVSHSGWRGLVAVGNGPLGVDLEDQNARNIEASSLLPLVAHPLEEEALLGADPIRIHAAFFRMWTRKEAYCKALGLGLAKDMKSFRIEDRPTGLEAIDPAEPGGPRFVCDLPAPDGFAAALACGVRAPTLRCRNATGIEIK